MQYGNEHKLKNNVRELLFSYLNDLNNRLFQNSF